MKEAIRIDTNGFYVEPELVTPDTNGVIAIYETPTLYDMEEQESPEPVLVGYRVAIPVPPGLYKPRFDLAAWETYNAPQVHEQDVNGQPVPLPRPDVQLWVEGLTQEEIDAIRDAPQPETDFQKIGRLEQEKQALEQRLQATEGAILFLMDRA